jgi:Flp pilus assembly CpaE family ATPase
MGVAFPMEECMQDVARIVLAVESEHLAQDVIDFLDRTDRTTVVDTVRDAAALAEVVGRENPDAVVGSPAIVRSAGSLNGSAFLAVSTEESVRTLRDAVDSGARGFFLWPSDRSALGTAAARTAHPHDGLVRRAKVIAVQGSRGGAGTTFVATHLAAAIARRGHETALVDAGSGDLAWALGVPSDAELRTLADLSPVRDEISEEHVRNALWTHATGIRALLAAHHGTPIDDAHLADVAEAATPLCDVLVVHAPRARSVVETDLLLVVVTLDVFAFRAAKRAIDGLDGRVGWEIVVNRAARGRIVAGDVERVFGKKAIAVLPSERRVAEAQDRGELVSQRSRVGRAVDRLAERVLQEVSA